eukprot:1919648-Rhodomonas_salina.2
MEADASVEQSTPVSTSGTEHASEHEGWQVVANGCPSVVSILWTRQHSSASAWEDRVRGMSQERQSESRSQGRLRRLMLACMLRARTRAAVPKLQHCDTSAPARVERARAEQPLSLSSR